MGTTAHVVVDGEQEGEHDGVSRALDEVQAMVEQLESRWSRFVGSSEISRINARAGEPVAVSPETLEVVDRAVSAWRWSDGRFDPSMGEAICRNGYDRSFDAVARTATITTTTTARSVGCAEVVVDAESSTICVPPGVQLDLGGIGKGRAADLAVERLVRRGCGVVCVNIGGDLCCRGGDRLDGGWLVDVEHPFDASRSVAWLGLVEGAVATSSRTRRRWSSRGRELHHLLDPRTGTPACSGLAQVTVLAHDAASAEVLAKAVFLAGADAGRDLVGRHGTAALLVADDGEVIDVGPIDAFRR